MHNISVLIIYTVLSIGAKGEVVSHKQFAEYEARISVYNSCHEVLERFRNIQRFHGKNGRYIDLNEFTCTEHVE
jgi:hypothetical protein